jgi:hypothetical protein
MTRITALPSTPPGSRRRLRPVLVDAGNEVHTNGYLVAVIGVLADDRLGDVLDPVWLMSSTTPSATRKSASLDRLQVESGRSCSAGLDFAIFLISRALAA